MFHLDVTTAPLLQGATGGGGGPPPLPHALLQHFVVATPTVDHRHELVKSMRAWRRGVRTLVLTNATGEALAREQAEGALHNEQWVHFPDAPGFEVTGKTGDPRAALAPVLASAHFGPSFKWLLFCDDDVAMLWPGMLRMLAGLDPEDPYFLSDSYYSRFNARMRHRAQQKGVRFGGNLNDGRPYQGVRNSHPPKRDQPRCLPCTFNDTGLNLGHSNAFKTCQCTVRRMHAAFQGILTGARQWEDFPHSPPISSVDGAGGVVFSAGLLSNLDPERYQACVFGGQGGHSSGPVTCGGGDCLLTTCLWKQGFAYTDPGFELRHRSERRGMFLFNGMLSDWQEVNRWASDSLVGACTGTCSRLWLDHMVSVHTAGADMSDYANEAANVRRFLGVMALYASSGQSSLEELAASLSL